MSRPQPNPHPLPQTTPDLLTYLLNLITTLTTPSATLLLQALPLSSPLTTPQIYLLITLLSPSHTSIIYPSPFELPTPHMSRIIHSLIQNHNYRPAFRQFISIVCTESLASVLEEIQGILERIKQGTETLMERRMLLGREREELVEEKRFAGVVKMAWEDEVEALDARTEGFKRELREMEERLWRLNGAERHLRRAEGVVGRILRREGLC